MKPRHQLNSDWPTPPFHLVLVHPEIPGNTGNIARLCAATGSVLHLVEPLGFQITDAAVKRAGLDYWDAVAVHRYPSLEAWLEQRPDDDRLFFCSTRAQRSYTDVTYRPGDTFVFGSESTGLPQDILDQYPDQGIGIPIHLEHVRSLNLASTAAIVLYEGLRQLSVTEKF